MKYRQVFWLFSFLLCFSLLLFKFTASYRRVLETPVDMWTQDHTADCALVLTGGPQRVREGFDLLARQNVRKLIVSGVNPSASFAELLPSFPYYGAVHSEDVILERKSLTTYGNVQQSIPLIEALSCRDVIVITSHLHMYRALRTLRAELPSQLNVIPRSVSTGADQPSVFEVSLEVLKVLFYSIWAF